MLFFFFCIFTLLLSRLKREIEINDPWLIFLLTFIKTDPKLILTLFFILLIQFLIKNNIKYVKFYFIMGSPQFCNWWTETCWLSEPKLVSVLPCLHVIWSHQETFKFNFCIQVPSLCTFPLSRCSSIKI